MPLKIQSIALTKEIESPENPQALEKRVALVPKDVQQIINVGYDVFVEEGAGEGIGFNDDEYIAAGATLQSNNEIYQKKDLVIKFKGPSLESISKMYSGSLLFCMAHFHSFPKRAQLLKNNKINVLAMEEILESPKFIPDHIIFSKCFVADALKKLTTSPSSLHIGFLGFDQNIIGGIRRAGNRNTQSLTLYQNDIKKEELEHTGANSIYFYDSKVFTNSNLLNYLKDQSCQLFNLNNSRSTASTTIQNYRNTHPLFEFGGRRIQCLHETGMAGARYGFKVLKEISSKQLSGNNVKAAVLGYGNVGMGAIDECYQQGVRSIHILGRSNTTSERIKSFINKTDLIINGAEQPRELRGKNYLITSEHTKNIIQKQSVVIDLVGGSPTNRSPVEDVTDCTFLTNPHFCKNDIYFSALWGWPMLGMMKESAIKYSGQITDVLIGREELLKKDFTNLEDFPQGIKNALVCGPF